MEVRDEGTGGGMPGGSCDNPPNVVDLKGSRKAASNRNKVDGDGGNLTSAPGLAGSNAASAKGGKVSGVGRKGQTDEPEVFIDLTQDEPDLPDGHLQ